MIERYCDECKYHYDEVGPLEDGAWTCKCRLKKGVIKLNEIDDRCYILNKMGRPYSRYRYREVAMWLEPMGI